MIFSIAGTAFSLAGIFCLYQSWQQRSWTQGTSGKRWLVPVGWLLLVVATTLWIPAQGAEFGIAYGLMSVSVIAWLVVFINFEIRQQKTRDKLAGQLTAPDAKALWRHFLLFVTAVPLSGAAAMLVSVALTLLVPWRAVNEMVLAVYLMPVLWGLASYWACADEKILRPALGLLACGTLSAIFIYS